MELLSHQPMLTALASQLVGAADADDVVQETFLRALCHPPPDTGAPMAPWLVTVARNLAMDVLRRRARFEALDEEAIEGSAPRDPLRPDPGILGRAFRPKPRRTRDLCAAVVRVDQPGLGRRHVLPRPVESGLCVGVARCREQVGAFARHARRCVLSER